ncbi:hypothetical protein NECAME_00714 [Necator americanus]|uniref:Uncharacterized protein n=2 Tax=Necator americanus TaxID=51031 RepID=W2SYC9_NECAM|nr:hypothetical protein NECAME_00714 [Necator americanus]ETN73627.1 hypothetical protein NECAME_00714 [Necator americanus]
MRLPDFLSAVTLNVVLALFSMLMAIVALGLLAFVLAKDTYLQKETLPTMRDKIKRHESVVVDFKNPSTVPDHFLQLNTLMFQKKPKNNLITEMPALPLSGMHMMSSTGGNEGVEQELSPLQAESEVASNKVSSVLRAQRSASEGHETTDSPSSFVTDSGISDEDYSSDSNDIHDEETKTSTENSREEGSGWVEERRTIEPPAEKIIVNLECGSDFSLC